MRAKLTVLVVTVATVAYAAIAVWQATVLIGTGEPAVAALGVALLILPLIGLVLVWREVTFGFHVQQMARTLMAEGFVADQLEDSESPDPDEAFARQKVQTQRDPSDWRQWYLLAASYDAARDRKRARAAMRYAYSLYRGSN